MGRADQLAAELAAAGRALTDRGVLASIEGNLSARIDSRSIVTTPSGVHKGRLDARDMLVVDRQGRTDGRGTPSSEIRMHLAIYEERADVAAVVHAHPPVATGYAVAGRPLPAAALAEAVATLGCVPVAPYGTPSTSALADSVREPVRTFDVILLANHGAVAVGSSVDEAAERMVQLEHFAHIALVAETLGGPRSFRPEQIAELSALRERAGAAPVPAVCYPGTEESGTITLTSAELVELIADAIRRIR